jgi:hypothetical protein
MLFQGGRDKNGKKILYTLWALVHAYSLLLLPILVSSSFELDGPTNFMYRGQSGYIMKPNAMKTILVKNNF